MLQKDYEKRLEATWATLKPGECFFVPCLDELQAKKIGLARGYYPRKNAPVAKVGIYRGMWGVLFFRESRTENANSLKLQVQR